MRLIKFCPGYWVNQIARMNQVVGENNCIDKSGGRKRPDRPFTRNKFWKYSGCIILAVTFGVKLHHLWVKLNHLSVIRIKLHCKIHYTDMVVVRNIYERYTVISIVLITVMLANKVFHLTLLHSFIGYYFYSLLISP